jgi:hypothetical protein
MPPPAPTGSRQPTPPRRRRLRAWHVLASTLAAMAAFGTAVLAGEVRDRDDSEIEAAIEGALAGTPDDCPNVYTADLMERRFQSGEEDPMSLCRKTSDNGGDSVSVSHLAIEGDTATATAEVRYAPTSGPASSHTIRVALIEQDRWRVDQISVTPQGAAGSSEALRAVEPSPEWIEFAAAVDIACACAFSYGQAWERQAELTSRGEGWSGPETEAAIRYSWANSLEWQYETIRALGPPPSRTHRFDRWVDTVLRRSELYRAIGRKWEDGGADGVQAKVNWLHYEKIVADEIAAPLPFRVCGRPIR